jgi:hypothetical protein
LHSNGDNVGGIFINKAISAPRNLESRFSVNIPENNGKDIRAVLDR